MNNKRLVICDLDEVYSMRLAEFLRMSECNYEIVVYTEPQRFLDVEGEYSAYVLLIDYEFEKCLVTIESEAILKYNAKKIFHLISDRMDVCETDKAIYKYQSAVNIIQSIGEDIKDHQLLSSKRNSNKKLIGVYSPISHSLKTSFALTLGLILAEHNRVLYINLEGYNGLYRIIGGDIDLSIANLMYEFSLKSEALEEVIEKYVVKCSDLYYITPAKGPFELQEIEPALWISFLVKLMNLQVFDAVILDISDAIRGNLEILSACDEVYVPIRKDRVSLSKYNDFEDILKAYPDGEAILNRIKKIKFPYFKDMDGSMYDLKHTELGRYVRKMVG